MMSPWKVAYSGRLKDVKSFNLSGRADGGQCARTDRSGGATRDVAAIGQIHVPTVGTNFALPYYNVSYYYM